MKKVIIIEQGTCPYCGSNNIDYGEAEITEAGLKYPATCDDCGKDFDEWYDITFSGQYKDGEPLEVTAE